MGVLSSLFARSRWRESVSGALEWAAGLTGGGSASQKTRRLFLPRSILVTDLALPVSRYQILSPKF